MYEVLRRASGLTEQTELQLEGLILDKSLRPGDRLPSERELGEKLGVSKTVVREAVRSLAARGLVEVRAGSGTYVRQFDQDVMSRPMNLLLRAGDFKVEHVHEVRQVLEVNLAGFAAERAQENDIENMQETIRRLESPQLSATEFAEADVAFHQALAAAAGNPLFSVLANAINDVMIDVRLRAYAHNSASVERALYYHTRILDRIGDRDVAGARQAMEEHIEYSLGIMRRAAALENRE
jgi:GntR family transcriptional repressor for pyruvate dehydrogenase complex